MKDSSKNRGCLSLLFPAPAAPAISRKREPEPAMELHYRVRDNFLSPAERSFYGVVQNMIGSRLVVLTKVNLNDIFYVSRPNENQGDRARIAQKHVDFLVCTPAEMKPIFGIELDDSSHQAPDRRLRDEFVDQVFNTAGLPLLHFIAKHAYTKLEIAEKITPYVRPFFLNPAQNTSVQAAQTNPIPPTAQPVQVITTPPQCPKCGIPMVLRVANQGEHKGEQFWGCANYPKCREFKVFNG
ncbi:MAG: DUF2726 domain-containing protein [Anaerolineaceae bacterium]|nr:DUF2726 domain-containing protein [Anaerolineaceae bacterium]